MRRWHGIIILQLIGHKLCGKRPRLLTLVSTIRESQATRLYDVSFRIRIFGYHLQRIVATG